MKFFEQIESWEVLLFVCGSLILGVHFARQIDFENMFKKDSATPVHMGGEYIPPVGLSNVQLVSIPPTVYESLAQDGKFKRYLTGNHKYVFMFTYPGCPYARAFEQSFIHLFNTNNFAQYYRKRIISVGRTTSVSCPGHQDLNCATAWVYRHCFGNVCIFNPVRKEAIVDASHQAGQLERLLDRYKEW